MIGQRRRGATGESRVAASQLSEAGRRGPRKGDLKEQAILATAERLLAQRPMAGITVDELARGAGITRPTFYFYFDSREALVRSLAARVAHDMYKASRSWLRRTDEPPVEAIRRSVAANLRVWREHGGVLRAVERARESDPAMAHFWADISERFVSAVAEQIARERDAGLAPIGPPDAADLAHTLVVMTERANHDASMLPPSPSRDRAYVDTVTSIWLRSIYGTVS